jgi:xanthine dehydrogenase molybdopterin-binding subunit B
VSQSNSKFQVEITVGEPPIMYTLSIKEGFSTAIAQFTAPTHLENVWAPIPTPSIFQEYPQQLESVKTFLAGLGCILEEITSLRH